MQLAPEIRYRTIERGSLKSNSHLAALATLKPPGGRILAKNVNTLSQQLRQMESRTSL